jgi:hypothetical protein
MRNDVLVLLVVFGGVLGGCDGDDRAFGGLPYPVDTATVIGDYDNPERPTGFRVVSTPDGNECINLDDACVKPQETCGNDGVADVLLDDTGAVVSVICYPTDGVVIEEVEGDLDGLGNNVVVVLDDAADGVDVEGDVTITGNNVTLFGHGPDTSVIGGDLAIEKNNALVRGLRVQGDVTIAKNNASIVDCVIEGDLTIDGNNTAIALCDVWGTLTIAANNTVLVGNRFAAEPNVNGNNTVCNGNVAFDDANDDGEIADGELGDAVVCSGKAKDE